MSYLWTYVSIPSKTSSCLTYLIFSLSCHITHCSHVLSSATRGYLCNKEVRSSKRCERGRDRQTVNSKLYLNTGFYQFTLLVFIKDRHRELREVFWSITCILCLINTNTYYWITFNLSHPIRDLYYCDVPFFGSQGVVDEIVENLACMLRVPRHSLRVVNKVYLVPFSHFI